MMELEQLRELPDGHVEVLYAGIAPLQYCEVCLFDYFFEQEFGYCGCPYCGHDCGLDVMDDLEAACTCDCHEKEPDEYWEEDSEY
jgi:hypothetical protein